MNYLAHLYLPHPSSDLVIGGFLGDFVKGRVDGRWEPGIRQGVRLHRAIDQYSDQHPVVAAMREQFPAPYRRYTGIIVDIVFDHFLAAEWHEFKVQPSLHDFASEQYELLINAPIHDEPIRAARQMQARGALQGYANPLFVTRALTHIGTRLKRTNPLGDCEALLHTHHAALYSGFRAFFPDLEEFVADWINAER